jgi:hypothetical protein
MPVSQDQAPDLVGRALHRRKLSQLLALEVPQEGRAPAETPVRIVRSRIWSMSSGVRFGSLKGDAGRRQRRRALSPAAHYVERFRFMGRHRYYLRRTPSWTSPRMPRRACEPQARITATEVCLLACRFASHRGFSRSPAQCASNLFYLIHALHPFAPTHPTTPWRLSVPKTPSD